MSFGYSVSDAILLVQLAWKTVQNSRKACGEYDELTRELSSLDVVIQRLEKEASKPESPINRPGDKCKEELQAIVDGCGKVLKRLNMVLEKYNTLSEKERSTRRFCQMVRFGNGELANMRCRREEVTYYTSTLSVFLTTVSLGSIGRVEQQIEATDEEIKKLRIAMNWMAALQLSTNNRQGSISKTYMDDDEAVDKEFRREAIEKVFSSSIMSRELRERGLLDDRDPHNIENIAGLAGIHPDYHATPLTVVQNVPEATFMALLKTNDPGDGYKGRYGNRVDARTEGMAEDLDRGASLFKNGQDKSYYTTDRETTGDGHSKGANDIPANFDRLQSLWQEDYFSIVLPRYENLMSNPPSDRMSRLYEYAKLRFLILSRILIPLHAVNSRGNEGRARQIKDLFDRTDEMQYKLFEAENLVYEVYFNEEARRQRVENFRRQNDAIILTKRKDMMVAVLKGDSRSDADVDLVSTHNVDVPGSSSISERVKDAVPDLPARKAPSHSSAYQSPCPMRHRKRSLDSLLGGMLLQATTC